MAKKTYRAFGSILSLNVVAHGRNIRVSFAPVSNYEAGRYGSIYETEDEEIQKALESRNAYGKKYVLVGNHDWNENSVVENAKEDVVEEKQELKVIKVNGLEDAKVWLVEHCDWKPTARPTKASVIKVAESLGYTFDGLK